HRGHFPDEARILEDEIRAAGRRVSLLVADAGDADGALAGATHVREVAGPRSVGLMVHALSGASLRHFLGGDGAGLHPKQFEQTFNYLRTRSCTGRERSTISPPSRPAPRSSA